MSEHELSNLQYCWINRWYMKKVMPKDLSYGDGLNFLVCSRCGDKLPVSSQASRKIYGVRDEFGKRIKVDVFCLSCYDYLHHYNDAEIIEAVRS